MSSVCMLKKTKLICKDSFSSNKHTLKIAPHDPKHKLFTYNLLVFSIQFLASMWCTKPEF